MRSGFSLRRERQRLVAVRRLEHRRAVVLEHGGEERAHVGLVVDDQDSCGPAQGHGGSAGTAAHHGRRHRDSSITQGVGHEIDELRDLHVELVVPDQVGQAVDAVVARGDDDLRAGGRELVGLDLRRT